MPDLYIPRIKGVNAALPLGFALQEDGAFCSEMVNLRPDHGEVTRVPGLSALANPPALLSLSGNSRGDDEVLFLQEIELLPYDVSRWLLITEKEGFLGQPGDWHRINPVHDTGTVDVTLSSTTVTGNSTFWSTRGIRPGDWFTDGSGAYWEIDAVVSNTEITLTAAYTGSTASGIAYEIVRQFGGGPYFATTQQGDLYVAGTVSSGLITGSTFSTDGGVLKIANGADGSTTSWDAASDVTYLTSGKTEVESGVDNLGSNTVIYGFGKLSDGRLLIAHHFFDRTTTPKVAGGRRLSYSSPTDLTTWTTAPGGSTDIESFEGAITALVVYTNSVSVHLTDGIAIGEFTGSANEPLRLRPSRSNVGAGSPHMVRRFSGGSFIRGREVFLGFDLRPYVFNGLDATPVPIPGIERLFQRYNTKGPSDKEEVFGGDNAEGYCLVDENRGEVGFGFYFDEGAPAGTFGNKTREVRFSYMDGSLWVAQWPGRINYGIVPRISAADSTTRQDSSPPLDAAIYLSSTADSWWWNASESSTTDAFSQTDGNNDGVYLRIEGIDAGTPHKEKTIQEILVFFRDPREHSGSTFSPTLTFRGEQSVDQEALALAATIDPLSVSPVDASRYRGETVAVYYGSGKRFRSGDLTIASPDDDSWPVTLTRILISYEETGDVRTL